MVFHIQWCEYLQFVLMGEEVLVTGEIQDTLILEMTIVANILVWLNTAICVIPFEI